MSIRQTAIIGAGPAGLIASLVLRYHGVSPEEILLVDDADTPLATWSGFSAAIAQRDMRSESDGHFFATDFPGLALLDALHEGSPLPLLRSAVNRYHPSLASVIRHGKALARHYGIDRSLRRGRIVAVQRRMEPIPHFELTTATGVTWAARHVFLALGHGPLRWPGVSPADDPDLAGRLVHAYQPKRYGKGRIIVVGSGMAATGEWVNALRAGAHVVSIRRRAGSARQALSAPRCAFSSSWLDRYHRLDPARRAQTLDELARGTSPRPAAWQRVLHQGEREGQLDHRVGEVVTVRPVREGVEVSVRGAEGVDVIGGDLVIAATGFRYGWGEHDLVRSLVDTYGLTTYGDHLVLADDCTLPGLSLPSSAISVGGPAARWAFPASDSFAGMKYASRRFAEHATQRRAFGPHLLAWWDMVRAGRPHGAENE